MLTPGSLLLPLRDVDVTVGADELFVINEEHRDTRYFKNLDDAWQFSQSNGGWGTPDAIQILSPLGRTASRSGTFFLSTIVLCR